MRNPTAQKIEEHKAAESSAGSRKKPGIGRGNHPNSRKQLKPKPWPKGTSGNPSGKPGFDVAAFIARKIFEQNAKEIYEGMTAALLSGKAYDFSVLADRAYGKMKDKTELSGPDGDAIKLLVTVVKPTLKDLK